MNYVNVQGNIANITLRKPENLFLGKICHQIVKEQHLVAQTLIYSQQILKPGQPSLLKNATKSRYTSL